MQRPRVGAMPAAVSQTLMPMIFATILGLGVGTAFGWRIAMLVPGIAMLVVAWLYWKYTQDCPQGTYRELRAVGVEIECGQKGGWSVLTAAAATYRQWRLVVVYVIRGALLRGRVVEYVYVWRRYATQT